MKILFKQTGKLRPAASQSFELPEEPFTLRSFLEALVRHEVALHNDGMPEAHLLHFITPTDIQTAATTGKVGFGASYNTGKADPDQAVATALTAFEDGLYAVFFDNNQATDLQETLPLHQETTATILRLTLLTGR